MNSLFRPISLQGWVRLVEEGAQCQMSPQPHHSHQSEASLTGKTNILPAETGARTQCALTRPRSHKRLPVERRPKGQILKTESGREAFGTEGTMSRKSDFKWHLLWRRRLLDGTKAEHYAAVTKPSSVCLLWRCCPVALAAMYRRDDRGLCSPTRTGASRARARVDADA